uniref:Uncharacterized protein n=1 Tax=Rhipicephalus zambeziensis TaxID=60191 RepID=A0A224Y9J1_9ACAR
MRFNTTPLKCLRMCELLPARGCGAGLIAMPCAPRFPLGVKQTVPNTSVMELLWSSKEILCNSGLCCHSFPFGGTFGFCIQYQLLVLHKKVSARFFQE